MRLPNEECCCNATLDGELQYLQEEITDLAEDIIEIDGKVEEIDDHQFAILELLKQMSEVSLGLTDIVKDDTELIKDLEGKFQFHDTTILVLFIIFLVWNLILTYNVFF